MLLLVILLNVVEPSEGAITDNKRPDTKWTLRAGGPHDRLGVRVIIRSDSSPISSIKIIRRALKKLSLRYPNFSDIFDTNKNISIKRQKKSYIVFIPFKTNLVI